MQISHGVSRSPQQNKTLAPYTGSHREPVSRLSTTWGNQHGAGSGGAGEGGEARPEGNWTRGKVVVRVVVVVEG